MRIDSTSGGIASLWFLPCQHSDTAWNRSLGLSQGPIPANNPLLALHVPRVHTQLSIGCCLFERHCGTGHCSCIVRKLFLRLQAPSAKIEPAICVLPGRAHCLSDQLHVLYSSAFNFDVPVLTCVPAVVRGHRIQQRAEGRSRNLGPLAAALETCRPGHVSAQFRSAVGRICRLPCHLGQRGIQNRTAPSTPAR